MHHRTKLQPKYHEPLYIYETIDEIKSHLKKHLYIKSYRSNSDFIRLINLFLSSTALSLKEKIKYLKNCIKVDTYILEKYLEIASQLPRFTNNINELIEIAIPFYLSLPASDFYHQRFVLAIEDKYFKSQISVKDFCKILNAQHQKKLMADLLDFSKVFFSRVNDALMSNEFDGIANVVKIISNMQYNERLILGRQPAAHSIISKLLNKGVNANELFLLLKDVNELNNDLFNYVALIIEFSQHGINPIVIKALLQKDFSVPFVVQYKSHGPHKTEPRYACLNKVDFGIIFYQLAKYGLLPYLDYNHDMRKAIFNEIIACPSDEQDIVLQSILNKIDNDFTHLYWKKPAYPIFFGNKIDLSDYWKNKINAALSKIHLIEQEPVEKLVNFTQ